MSVIRKAQADALGALKLDAVIQFRSPPTMRSEPRHQAEIAQLEEALAATCENCGWHNYWDKGVSPDALRRYIALLVPPVEPPLDLECQGIEDAGPCVGLWIPKAEGVKHDS